MVLAPAPSDLLESYEAFDGLALSATSFDELTRAIGETIQPILDVPLTAIMAYDEARETLQMTPGSFGADGRTTASYQVGVSNLYSNAARVFATDQPYLSNDAVADPGIRPDYVHVFGVRRLLSIPLRTGLRRVGVLHLANKPTDFTAEDLAHAQLLAPRIAMVVETGRTSFRLHREQQLQGVLSSIAVAIASGRSSQHLLPEAMRNLCVATSANVLSVDLAEAAPIVCRSGPDHPALERSLLEEARRQPSQCSRALRPAGVGDPGSAVVHVPVLLESQRVGTVSALRTRGEPFAHDEFDAFSRLSQLVALAWASERHQQQLAQLTRTEERRRISDELRDDVRQILADAQAELEDVLAKHGGSENLLRARGLVARGSLAVARVGHRLEEPFEGDLPTRLAAVVFDVQDGFALNIRIELMPVGVERSRHLRAAATDTLVKVAREALINVAKHGGPCDVVVRLESPRNGYIRLVVEDDGVGMPGQSGRGQHGLAFLRRSVREVGGRLQVRAAGSGGTRVLATVPI